VLVIDCGSTGSRLNILERKDADGDAWTPIDWQSFGVTLPGYAPKDHGYNRLETMPGIHEAAERGIEDVRKLLQPILDWATAVFPAKDHKRIPILLFATAGVRKLSSEAQNVLMADIEHILSTSPFMFEPGWARVITGEDEGIFSWVSVNYKLGAFQEGDSTAPPPVSVIDMGGSSLQASCVVEDEANASTSLRVLGQMHHLQVESFVKYGMNDAFDSTLEVLQSEQGSAYHPCLQEGYAPRKELIPEVLEGKFDFEKCKALIDRSAKSNDVQRFSTKCGGGDKSFVALAGFYLVYNFFELNMDQSVSEMAAFIDRKCSEPYQLLSETQREHLDSNLFCFRAVYADVALADWMSLKDQQITVANSSEWAVGSVLLHEDQLVASHRQQGAQYSRFRSLSPLVSVALLCSVLAVLYILSLQSKKKNKTSIQRKYWKSFDLMVNNSRVLIRRGTSQSLLPV